MIAIAALFALLGGILIVLAFFLDTDSLFFSGMVIIIVGLCLGFFAAVMADSQERNRLMAQCLRDGNPEYKCVSMLKQDVVPVVIPMGR